MRVLTLLLLLGLGSSAAAAELRVYPPEVAIGGPNRTQQLIVVREADGRAIADFTGRSRFASSNPAIAKVDASGLVTAIAAGEATITASADAQSASVKVKVAAAGPWSFRNHVIPTLTKNGCNSGGCHGALAGKGGLKLSLRGYDPDSDYFVLTRQALARRVDLSAPAGSLLLKKATRVMPHGGGRRFESGSDFHNLFLDWIKAGAPGPRESDASLVRLDVFPKAALLQPKNSLRIVVRAVYSDGSSEDATRWARFGSSEELVASVTEDGLATVAGFGEAAITVNFGTKVAALTITSPYANAPAADAFAHSPRNNFIDEHRAAEVGTPTRSAIGAKHGRRVRSPGIPRYLRRPSQGSRDDGIRRRPRSEQARQAHR